ncbi:DEAD/DEAH box helicase family protein [Streptomyces noursei]|uniref:DEAD/DEAH box helicase family protein n=1 Tax=Streptomyces noursei TaxID=1971 RepID=UPI0021A7956F|nr:DEAD/DEAH box helicase family protein [Streptomyces noursei]UWS69814.1 DEAD/DEAH box helicase family protein [Streptomyces noursei]UWS76965.1 DEAD/DEAH box helicase family protein [Streptomyces noursei]
MAPTELQLRPTKKGKPSRQSARVLGNHPRASVIAACGTGKTLIAARTTARTAPHGRVLVLLPTLDLLSKPSAPGAPPDAKGTAIAVCSARQALDHEPLGADVPSPPTPPN